MKTQAHIISAAARRIAVGLALLAIPAVAQTEVDQTESNDSIGSATPTGLVAGATSAVFSTGNTGDGPHGPTVGDGSGDFDFFALEAGAGQVILLDANAAVRGANIDTVAGIYNSTGALVASNDDDGDTTDSFLTYTVTTAGEYFPVIGSFVTGGAEQSLPTNPNSPGTGPGSPGSVGDYEVVIGLDTPVYLSHTAPTFPLLMTGESALGSFSITNRGQQTATITRVESVGEDASRYVINQAVPFDLPPNATRDIDVTFSPGNSTDPRIATIEIASNDVVHPVLGIPLAEGAVEGLLLRLAFDDPPGSPLNSFAAPLDISGNGFLAAYVVNSQNPVLGRPPLAGEEGSSVMFIDGGGTACYVLTSNALPHTASFTYSVWVRPTGGAGDDTLFNRDPAFSQNDTIYGCTIGSDGRVFFRISGVEVVASEAGAVEDDSTHHIVLSHHDPTGFGDGQAERTRLYIDGVLVSENTDTLEVPEYQPAPTNSRLWIATRSAAGTGFNGDMDDFQLYNIELEPDVVADLFANPGTAAGDAPRPPFAITSIERSPDGTSATITWNSRPNRTYALDASPDLQNWEELDDGIPSGGDTTTVVEEAFIQPSKRTVYYRIKEFD